MTAQERANSLNNSSCSPNNQLPDVRRSQVSFAGQGRDQYTQSSARYIVAPTHGDTADDHRQREPNTLADGQPVKFAKHQGDMIELPYSRVPLQLVRPRSNDR